MKTLTCTLAILFFILTGAFAQEDVRGKWKPKPVHVDGVPTEWNNPLRLYHAETVLFFDIENDSTTLYICFQCKDEPTQMKINKAGMKIEIKTKGKIKRVAAVSFPLTGKKEINAEEKDARAPLPDIEHLKHGFVLQNVDLSAEGFATQNGIIPLKDTSGIRAAINWDKNNVMTYELSIPLKELFGSGFSLADFTKAQVMKVEINSFNRPVSNSPEDSPASGGGGVGMSGGARGGMGGMGGGMGGGGGRGGGGHHGGGARGGQGSGSKDSQFDSKKMKQGFFLAQRQ